MAGYEDIRVGVSDAIIESGFLAATRPRRVVVQYDWQDDSLHAFCNDGTEFVRQGYPGAYEWVSVSAATIPQPE